MAEWDRLPDETDRAWAAWTAYLAMPPKERSLEAATRVLYPAADGGGRRKRAGGAMAVWAARHRWRERAAAYDLHRLDAEFAATAEIRKQIAVEGWGELLRIIRLQSADIDAMPPAVRTQWSVALRGHLDALGVAPPSTPPTVEIRFVDDDDAP